MNPVKEIRTDKNLSLSKFAELLDSNTLTLNNVEEGNCKESTYLTIIRKMSLKFDEIDDRKLLREYKKWEPCLELS